MNGQLTDQERVYLHQAVLNFKPSLVFEVGTWKGGGSTWQIVEALNKNGKGILYTCESDKDFFEEAATLYGGSGLIRIFFMESGDLVDDMIGRKEIPDFLFFDGPEDRETAYEDFMKLDPYLKSGAIFCMHDWDAPSIKAETLRPHMENSNQWKFINKLTHPASVGICLFQKI